MAATLNGERLTAAQLAAQKRKWASQDKAYWKKSYQADVKRKKERLSVLKKRLTAELKRKAVTINITKGAIKRTETEIKDLQTKIKKL